MVTHLKSSLSLAEDAAREAQAALTSGEVMLAKAKIFEADAWIEAAKAQMKAIITTGKG